LSERELEVLSLLVKGRTNKQMAEQLYVSINTIKTHVKNIYCKLGVENRTEATSKAINFNIIEGDSASI
jgi:DNA-binding NarL/FixJ family response regulator